MARTREVTTCWLIACTNCGREHLHVSYSFRNPPPRREVLMAQPPCRRCGSRRLHADLQARHGG